MEIPKRGRPYKGSGYQPHDTQFVIRMRPEQAETVRQTAAAAGMSINQYFRCLALGAAANVDELAEAEAQRQYGGQGR